MDKLTRARRALEVAREAIYTYKYDEDSALVELERIRDDIEDDYFDPSGLTVERYLVICTEDAGEGEADWALFCRTKEEAMKEQTEYAQSGWASWLYDLDSDDYTKAKRERYPR